jgi:4-hydroxyphenylpyruvate dioxygenase
MKKSIATVSFGGKLTEKLDAIAAAHFDGVEIFEPNLRSSGISARDIGRYARNLGLSVDLFQPLRDFEGVSDEQLRRNLDRAEAAFDTMEELGAPLMLVCSNTEAGVLDDDERSAAQLFQLAERAGERGLKIGYEALAWGTRVATFDKAFRIVKRANNPYLGLILDSFHTLVRPDDWSSLGALPADRIFFVQLGDAPRMDVDALTLRRNYSKMPCEGDLDVTGFLRAALATGYTGTVSVEIFNESTTETPLATARSAMHSLLVVEERARGSNERDTTAPTAAGARGRST